MEKIKAMKNTDKLCWKCLKEKDKIHELHFGPLGYGSGFDNCSTKIQLCDGCYKESDPEIWSTKIVYDSDDDREYDFGHYINEDKIFEYFDSLPVEGRQFVWNEFYENGYQMDPQDWIDYELGILPHEKAKEYGLYSTQEIDAYREQFPKCKWPANRMYSDDSKGCWCPFGAHGEYGQKAGQNISDECYQCKYYAERNETEPIKSIPDSEFSDYEILTRAEAIKREKKSGNELELILFTNWNKSYLPEELRAAANKNPDGFFKNRSGSVVEQLKKCAYPYESLSDCTREDLRNKIEKIGILYDKSKDVYYYIEKDGYFNQIGEMRIVKINTSRSWILENHNNIESIRYIEMVDIGTGFCRLKD